MDSAGRSKYIPCSYLYLCGVGSPHDFSDSPFPLGISNLDELGWGWAMGVWGLIKQEFNAELYFKPHDDDIIISSNTSLLLNSKMVKLEMSNIE